MATNSSLTKELGHGGLTEAPWNSFFNELEYSPDLAWPNGIEIYDKMLNDAQIAALMLALLLPIYRYEWYVDPNGAEDKITEHIADDLGLPVLGQDVGNSGRLQGRFNFAEHLKVALPLPLRYGNAFFEQLYKVDGDLLHLRKLAPRMPRTISEVVVAPDGGLIGIIQKPGAAGLNNSVIDPSGLFNIPAQRISSAQYRGIPIPVNRLVAYVHEKEGGNWFGNPILRAIYREWLTKDKLIKIDTIKHEINGMGSPVGKLPEHATDKQQAALQAVVSNLKATHGGASVIPYGSEVTLEGVRGTLPDTLASIKECNEAMSRRFLAMFTNLGATNTGSRALGETFVDAFAVVQESIAEEFTDTFNAYVIEDLVTLNWGEDAQLPKLAFKAAEKELSVADLKLLVDCGALDVDDNIKEYVRDTFDLPEIDPNFQPPEKLAPIVPIKQGIDPNATDPNAKDAKVDDKTGKAVAAGHIEASEMVNGRPLRRNMTEVEMVSKVNFESMDTTYNGAVSYLIAQWQSQVSQPQIDSLTKQIEASNGDLTKIANIEAPILGAELLAQEMMRVATVSITQAVAEAKAQGTEIIPPSPQDLADDIAQRAQAMSVIMAKSLTDAAARNAINGSGGSVSAQEIAQTVKEHLSTLSDSFLKDNLGGAINTAQNDARFATFATVENEIDSYYASELLDRSCCVAPEVLITTNRGDIRADEVTFSDRLLTHTGSWKQPSAITKSEIEGELLTLSMSSGKALRLTAEHQVLVSRAGSILWVMAGNIVPGDAIVHQSSVEIPTEFRSVDYMFRNSPYSETSLNKISSFPSVGISSHGMPIVPISFDDQISDLEVDNPRTDLCLRYEVEKHVFEQFSNNLFDSSFSVGRDVTSLRAVSATTLDAGDDSKLFSAVSTVVNNGRTSACFATETLDLNGDSFAKGSPAAFTSLVGSSMAERTSSGTVVVSGRVGFGDFKRNGTTDTDLGDSIFGSSSIRGTVFNATLVAAIDRSPSVRTSDLLAARTAKRKRVLLQVRPPSAFNDSTTSTQPTSGFPAFRTFDVHKDISIDEVVSVDSEDYGGFVFDFTIDGEHSFFANEMLVHNCSPCVKVDGTTYESMTDARKDYPSGLYRNCLGGPRCRGTIVCIFKSEAKPSVVDVEAKPFAASYA